MEKVTRRSFVTAVGAVTLLPLCARRREPGARRAADHPPYRFFDAAEARFVEAACARLIPADASGPGALAAGVVGYLDQHLAGAWGAGEHPYRDGAWQPGTAAAAAGAPAALFRNTLQVLNRHFESRGTCFSRLPAEAQDTLLLDLQDGGTQFAGIPTAAFFAALLAMTVEGFLSHPLYGSTRTRIAWRMSGFPGAYAVTS